MVIIVSLYLFIIGLAFGSFVLVLVDRMKAGKDWVHGRSKCDHCGHTLGVKDLVPLFSWLRARGKCCYCKVSLSKAYPLAELMVGTAFTFSYLLWPYGLSIGVEWLRFILWLFAVVLMAALVIFDLRWYLLPNKLVYPLIAAGALWACIDLLENGVSGSVLLTYALSLLVSAGFFYVLHMVSGGKWIGDGDVRLGVAIGLFVGSWQLAWLTIFAASVIGLLFSLTQVKKRGMSRMKMKIPFGPMLILSLFVVVLAGQQIVNWYQGSILGL